MFSRLKHESFEGSALILIRVEDLCDGMSAESSYDYLVYLTFSDSLKTVTDTEIHCIDFVRQTRQLKSLLCLCKRSFAYIRHYDSR